MARSMDDKLERFATQAAGALRDNLVSLVLYGSAARGDYDASRSDLNLLVVLQDASPAALRPAGAAIAQWARSGEPPPLIFSEQEWRSATDVFPIEIEDMRAAHRLLRGRDPFAGLATTRPDLRQQLEREIRGKLLHLRAEYAAAEADGRALSGLLEGVTPTFFVLFRALLRLLGRDAPTERRALVRETADAAGFDAAAFDWVLARLAGRKGDRLEAHDPRGAACVAALERLAAYIDGMGGTRAVEEGERTTPHR